MIGNMKVHWTKCGFMGLHACRSKQVLVQQLEMYSMPKINIQLLLVEYLYVISSEWLAGFIMMGSFFFLIRNTSEMY